MNFYQSFENICFFYGFRECKTDTTINFLKINEIEYLIFKLFPKVNTIDLIHAKFNEDESPCTSEPYWEKLIKPSFQPEIDSNFLKKYIDDLKKS